ncbi:hypothetical protein [Parabacteroides sp. PF5-9]|uniref:hypothetical protein n=1 Tax=Parabacteroides sp. PF5-9 TaxID=1742404 RepID=UPI0024736515|nr:hypothetical protein [Parabacteroides sp. PF5-9]MDH6356883.1 hypothetical protein [Parabacteroides sp. PF5-9]
MKTRLSILSLLLLILLPACEKENEDYLERATDDSTDYYWGGDRQIPLLPIKDRFYVMYYTADQERLKEAFAKVGVTLEAKDSFEWKNHSSYSCDMSGPAAWKYTNFKTETIEGDYEKCADILASTIYWGNYYLINERLKNMEIGVTEKFFVKFKSGTKLKQLKKLAKVNGVEIIGRDRFSPDWFILVCTNQSKGNSLQMANLFYSSGLFEAAEPSTVGGTGFD